MRQRRQTLIVAGWEFRRFFKWRDQWISLAASLVLGALAWGAGSLVRSGDREITIAASGITLEPPAASRLRFIPAADSPLEQAAMLRSGEASGILVAAPDGGFTLLVAGEPTWRGELERLLADHARRGRLEAAGLSSQDLAALLAPPPLELRYLVPARSARGRGERIVGVAMLVTTLLTIFTALAYLLAGITGEKQLRVTESVMSAISPQAWIDGKVLGIAAFSLVAVANMIVGGTIVVFAAWLTWDFSLPVGAVRPGAILLLALSCLLGLLLWNSCFAAIRRDD